MDGAVVMQVYAASFSPDGTIVATSAFDGILRLFSVETLALLADSEDLEDGMFVVTFSADGTKIFSAWASGAIRVFDGVNASTLWEATSDEYSFCSIQGNLHVCTCMCTRARAFGMIWNDLE